MSLPVVLFAVVAAVTCAAALGVVLSRSLVRAAVWLLLTLVGVAFVYFLLGAEFLGAAHLIVYVGGTMVLVVFGVMLTTPGPFPLPAARPVEWVVGGGLALALFVTLASASLAVGTGSRQSAIGSRETPDPRPQTPDPSDTLPGADALGAAFLGDYLLPFEIVSVHLLVVLVAAAYLARARRVPTGEKP